MSEQLKEPQPGSRCEVSAPRWGAAPTIELRLQTASTLAGGSLFGLAAGPGFTYQVGSGSNPWTLNLAAGAVPFHDATGLHLGHGLLRHPLAQDSPRLFACCSRSPPLTRGTSLWPLLLVAFFQTGFARFGRAGQSRGQLREAAKHLCKKKRQRPGRLCSLVF